MALVGPMLVFLICSAPPGEIQPTPKPQLIVAANPDDPPTCPTRSLLVHALGRRIPGLDVRVDGPTQADDLYARLSGQGNGWGLILARVDGTVLLERTLDQIGTDCQTAAEASALIIDRFLTELKWPGLPAVLDLPAPVHSAPTPETPAPESPPTSSTAWAVGGGALARAIGQPRYGGQLLAQLRFWQRLRASLLTTLSYPHTETVVAPAPSPLAGRLGQLQITTLEICATGGICAGDNPRACAELLAGVAITISNAKGKWLYREQSATRLGFVGGIQGELGWTLGWGLEAGGWLAVLAYPSPPAFGVEGLETAIYSGRDVDVALGARLVKVF